MLTLEQDWIAAQRTHIYRRTQERRISTIEAAEAFIHDVGIAFLWPIKGIEAPNLFHAIAGVERPVPMAHDDPDLSKCWTWKDNSLGSQRWYYSKLLRRKATLIAPRLWGAFYALTHNYGDLNDYMERVLDGKMTHEERLIYEAVLKHGPVGTVELRRLAGLASKENKSRFGRALTELQVDMKLLPVRVGDEGAWRYSFVYDIPMRHYPDLVEQAQQVGTAEAWQTLIGAYLDSTVALTTTQVRQMFHVFAPTTRELERTLTTLADAGQIQQATVDGADKKNSTVWVSSKALADS